MLTLVDVLLRLNEVPFSKNHIIFTLVNQYVERKMEADSGKILSKILRKQDLDKIPLDVANKIEVYFDQRLSELIITEALHSTVQQNMGKRCTFFTCL